MARKDEWLRRARAHPELSDAGYRALSFVSDHASVRETGFTWFALTTIAAGIGRSVSTARRALASALDCQLLRVVGHGDEGKSNDYWPWLDGSPLAGNFPVMALAPCSSLNTPPGQGGDVKSSPIPIQSTSGGLFNVEHRLS
jgi:hypothetical protein